MATRYIALLRGINVGGNNIIKMVDLKACFEQMGFFDIKTYIQSGNVAFNTAANAEETIQTTISNNLLTTFNYSSPVVVVSQEHITCIVNNAPKSFGIAKELYKYDVLFLKPPLTAAEAIAQIKLQEGVDQVAAGEGVLYFSRLISGDRKSYLEQIVKLPIYKQMTIRNWNTTSKLVDL